MARYRVLTWREIPTQIRVVDETGARADRMMPRWYMQEIARIAMREGLAGTDDYLAAFTWSEDVDRPGSVDEVADAVMAELASRWGRTPEGRRLAPGRDDGDEEPGQPGPGPGSAGSEPGPPAAGPMPAIYLGHGAPPLLEDAEWKGQLGSWARSLPQPRSILIVSAHWQTAPIALSSVQRVPLVYDFYGFPEHYYRMTYDAPGAPDLAARVRGLMPATEPVLDRETRGLDHGAWVPLKAMYPSAEIPVLQMSMPDLDPRHLFEVGRRLAPLRDEGVLIVGSGFMTHGLPFVHEYFLGKPGAPQWSIDFDQWATEALNRGDLDTLFAFREKAPGMPYAHPTVEHFAPIFVTLGAVAKPDESPDFTIEGYFYGLSKRSFEAR